MDEDLLTAHLEVPNLTPTTQNIFKGGGINRVKHHLAGKKGSVDACRKVDATVKALIQKSLDENVQKAREKKFSRVKRKANSEVDRYFQAGTRDSSQITIKAALQSKERWHETDLALAFWFYDACIPFNAVNSPFYQIAIDKIASMGFGYKGPSYHALRVPLLRDAKLQVGLIVDSYRSKWSDTGCTIMGDGWSDTSNRSLINFLVYCPTGIAFMKSVDASSFATDASNLCNLFAEIVDMVGPSNVVHMVTDNASNYKAAGRLLTERYPNVSWSPCSAHCVNLILSDIGSLEHVQSVIQLAQKVIVFVYNHKWALNWLRKRPNWREIIRPTTTRFGTAFIALKSLHDHRLDLQSFVVSGEFKRFSKTAKGKEFRQIILNERFWNNCLVLVKIMGPLIRLLRVCDCDEKPAMGYIYEGIQRVESGIKDMFKNQKKGYEPYINIIDNRWDKTLRKNIHAASYYLNPAFQYDPSSVYNKEPKVLEGLLHVISTQNVGDQRKTLDEIRLFRERLGSFGSAFAISTSFDSCPDEWWRMFGGDAPNLKELAIRILSQTASSSGCERNWSVFERIHTKKRNRLEHQRLNDLVYVHYNLRLQNRIKDAKRSYDPVDYESIDKNEFWVVEEEQEGELDYDELEEMLEEIEPRDTMPPDSRVTELEENNNDGDEEFTILDEIEDLTVG